jgi:WD40 repeat protein
MSAFATPAVLSGSLAPHRVFGSRPFHTDGELLALAFAADGTLWSVEEPGTLRQWDVAGQRPLAVHALDDPATWWTFSAGARRVAAGSDELSVWDVATGEFRFGRPMPAWVTAIAFRPDGSLVVTGHDDGMIRLWEPARGTLVQELAAHDGAISALRFDGSGVRLASAGEDRQIHLWDSTVGSRMRTLDGHTDRIPALAWHPDGQRLFSAGWDTTARVWNTATGEPIILLNSHAAQVHTLALSPDGTMLACADSANTVHLWDLQGYKTLKVFHGPAAELRCLTWSPDSRRLVAGGLDRVLHVWDVHASAEVPSQVDPRAVRAHVALGNRGRWLHALAAGTSLRTWEVDSGAERYELQGAGILRSCAVSPDGRWIAGSRALPGEPDCWHDPKLRQHEPPAQALGLWSGVDGSLVRWLSGPRPPLMALAFSPDSTTLATGGFLDTDVWLWNVATGEATLVLPEAAGGGAVEALAWHPAGRLLAVGGIDHLSTSGNDGQIKLWDVSTKRPVATLPCGTTALAIHPSGQRLAAATLGQTVRLWDVETAQPVGELIGHLDPVSCLAFSMDGRLLATGGDDRTLRLWDVDTGLPRGQVELDTQVRSLAFSPDGRWLFTSNGNTSCYQFAVDHLLS